MRQAQCSALRTLTKRAFCGSQGADSVGETPSCAADVRNGTSLHLNTWTELGRSEKKVTQPASHNDTAKTPKGICSWFIQELHSLISSFFFKERLIYQYKVKLLNKSFLSCHLGWIQFCLLLFLGAPKSLVARHNNRVNRLTLIICSLSRKKELVHN